MEQLTITAKVQIIVTYADKTLLEETMSAYCDACNYVSDYVFKTHNLSQAQLNKALYYDLREKYSLKAQMAQSVLKTVIARYKTILEAETNGLSLLSKSYNTTLYGTGIIRLQVDTFR